MKKLITSLTVITVVLVSCIFMTSAAFTTDYFSINVPYDYELEEGYNEYTWTKDNGTTIYIYHEDNTLDMDFESLSSLEISLLNDQVESNYSDIEGVSLSDEVIGSNVDFAGYGAYRYSVDCEIYGEEYMVIGYIFIADGQHYTFETVSAYEDRSDVIEIISSFTTDTEPDAFITEAYEDITEAVEDESPIEDEYLEEDHYQEYGEDIEIVSDDGKLSFVLPAGFVENSDTVSGVIDRMWLSDDIPRVGFAYGIRENETGESFDNLSDSELDTFLEYFLEAAGGSFSNTTIANYNKNGIKGIQITGDMSIVGVDCLVNSYMFTVDDDIFYVYTYEYDEGGSAIAEKIMSTLRIEGFEPEADVDTGIETVGPDDSGSSESGAVAFIIIGAVVAGLLLFGILLIVIIVVAVKKSKKKKQQKAMNQAPVMNAVPNGYTPVNPAMGAYPANNQGTYPVNNQGAYPANNQGAYPANNQGAYPANNQGAYPANNQGAYPVNNQGAYPANNQGAYPVNNQPSSPNNQADGNNPDNWSKNNYNGN